jgi:hypothetical protein
VSLHEDLFSLYISSSEQEALQQTTSSISEDLEAGAPLMASGAERAPWPVTLATLMALQLGWGLWLMPAVYAK